MNIALLCRQHAAIIAATDELTSLLSGSYVAAESRLMIARSTLARLVSEHLKTENELIHGPLQARGLTSKIPAYADIAAGTRELHLAYSSHVGTWRPGMIESDWSSFGAAARKLCSEMRNILIREERELFPIAQALLRDVE